MWVSSFQSKRSIWKVVFVIPNWRTCLCVLPTLNCKENRKFRQCSFYFYATLAYKRHFIFVGCYDNNPCYLVTNLAGRLDFAGHLDLAGFYYSKCPANSKCPAKFVTRYQVQAHIFILWWMKPKFKFKYIEFAWAWTRAPPDRKLTLYQGALDAIHNCVLVLLKTPGLSCFGGFFSTILAHFLQRSYSNNFHLMIKESPLISWLFYL